MVHNQISIISFEFGRKTSISYVNLESIKKMKYWKLKIWCRRSNFLNFLNMSLFFQGFFEPCPIHCLCKKQTSEKFIVWIQRWNLIVIFTQNSCLWLYYQKGEGERAVLPHYYAKYAINLNKSGLLVRPLVRLCLVVPPVLESRAFWNKHTAVPSTLIAGYPWKKETSKTVMQLKCKNKWLHMQNTPIAFSQLKQTFPKRKQRW